MNYFDRNHAYKFISNKKLVALFLFIIILLFKLAIINMPYYWDELGVISRVFWIYHHKLDFIGGAYDFGHPPLLYAILCIVWSIFGYSIWISHLIVIIFAFAGVYFTYLLGSELMNEKVGIIAALLLFFSPLYYAQAGILNLDMPLTAFIVMSIYFALKENTKLFIISGICLVMTKGPGLLLILAMLIYVLVKDYRKSKRVFFKRLFISSIPLIFFLSWLICHKSITGWLFYPRVFIYQINKIMFPLFQRTKALFSENYNFLISACMFSYFFLKKWPNNSKRLLYQFLLICLFSFLIKILFIRENASYLFLLLFFVILMIRVVFKKGRCLPLFLFILICLITFSSYVSFLPRYLLIVYPFYYIISAYCLSEIFKNRNGILIGTVAILIFLLISNWYGYRAIKSTGSGASLESNLEYIDVVKTHKLASLFIEENYPQSTVLTSWPQIRELSSPFLGYVTIPIKCVHFSKIKKRSDLEIDLIYYSDQSDKAFEMQKFMDSQNIRLLKSFGCNGKYAAVYKIIRNPNDAY